MVGEESYSYKDKGGRYSSEKNLEASSVFSHLHRGGWARGQIKCLLASHIQRVERLERGCQDIKVLFCGTGGGGGWQDITVGALLYRGDWRDIRVLMYSRGCQDTMDMGLAGQKGSEVQLGAGRILGY